MKQRYVALLCGLASSLCWSTWAAADPSPADAAQGAPASSQAEPGLEQITVTAQKREERLVDVPLTVTVVSHDQLAIVDTSSLENVSKLIPGLDVTFDGLTVAPAIRGITSETSGSSSESAIAIYVDGVYQADQTANSFDLSSVSDIEVLKGPQGTLFGRNATGGAILVRTLDPSFQGSANGSVSYGSFNTVQAKGYVDLPLTSTVAMNEAFGYRYSNDFVHDLRTDDPLGSDYSYNSRTKILWEPMDGFSLILTGVISSVDNRALRYYALDGDTIGHLFPGADPVSANPDFASANQNYRLLQKSNEFSAHATLDLSFASLSSISAFHKDKSELQLDYDLSYAPALYLVLGQNSKVFTQEVNLTSKPGTDLSYVVGAFYYRRDAAQDVYVNAPAFGGTTEQTSGAGYADLTYKFGRFSLLGGIRFTVDTYALHNGPGGDVDEYFQEARFPKWTDRLGARYALGDDSNLYATYTKGFKNGAYDLAAFDGKLVNPETIDAYEVGFKSQSRVSELSASAFFYNYTNVQVEAYLGAGAGAITQLLNAARAHLYGLDIDETYKITSSFDLRGAFAWTHARYTSFPNAPGFVPNPGNTGNTAVIVNAAGNPMERAPDYTANISANYHADIGAGQLRASATEYWRSRTYYSFDKSVSEPGYATLDALISYSPTTRYDVSIYGRNLTNKRYNNSIAVSALSTAALGALPVEFGVGFGFRY